jgi:diguanylate cyclase (GGDEF)-like protein
MKPRVGLLGPAAANRRSFLLLRWLVIILSAYLTLFTSVEEEGFVRLFLLVMAFALSNVLIGLLPLNLFSITKSKRLIACVDAAFISAFLYYLRVDPVQLHLPFIGIVVLSIFWPDLRIVLFALFVVSLLYGSLTNFQLFDIAIDVPIDAFLALSLLFIVSIFYTFMVDRFDRDTETSEALILERSNAENISDIVRKLSTSLESRDILEMLIGRLTAIMPEVKCRIFQMDSSTDTFEVLASSDTNTPTTVPAKEVPALQEAIKLKATASARIDRASRDEDAKSDGLDTLAIPLVARDEVIALMFLETSRTGTSPWDERTKFLEIVASATANALANAERFDRMKQMASSDSLTTLANHVTFKNRLTHELERARRHDRVVSLLMIDLDLLKTVNDRFGHPVGDRAIRSVADVIRRTCRDTDMGARYGGEEFALILPEADFEAGMQVAERVRKAIEEIDTLPVTVTASIGVATFPTDGESGADLIAAADKALYIAKQAGRNRVASLT